MKQISNSKLFNTTRKAVSPVIATVLIIALVISASGAIYILTLSLMEMGTATLIVENSTIYDANSNQRGDSIALLVNNLGPDDAIIENIEVYRNGTRLEQWGVGFEEVQIKVAQTQRIDITTVALAEEIIRTDQITIIVVSPQGSTKEIPVNLPPLLTSTAVFYDNDFSSGGTLEDYGFAFYSWSDEHGGGSNTWIISGNSLYVDTNLCGFVVMEDDALILSNFELYADMTLNDDDGIGFIYRYQDSSNFYWVGWTADHNGPNNLWGPPGHNASAPYFHDTDDGGIGRSQGFEVGMVSGGVASTTAIGSALKVLDYRNSATYQFHLVVSGSTFTIYVDGQELFSASDSTISTGGYFGFFSMASSRSLIDNILLVV